MTATSSATHPDTKVVYSATMSLDGFIAGPGGDMAWLKPFLGGPNPVVSQFITEVGAVLVGNRSYRGDDPHRGTEQQGKPFGGGWSGPQFVVTHDRSPAPDSGITFVGSVREGVAAAKAAAASGCVNVIGANIARQCLEEGELDEVLVFIAPVLLGDGVRLLDWPGGTLVRLEPVDKVAVSPAVALRMRVVAQD